MLALSPIQGLGWLGIIRLGFVQTSIGAIVVMTTSTLNRIMVVELALPAILPGLLVAFHYFVQVIRPRMGFASDQGLYKTPWILGGIIVLGLGGIGAAIGTVMMAESILQGIIVSFFAFLMIGIGVSMSGTSLLALLAKSVDDQKRAAAATIVWLMMIFGFAVTSILIGKFLDPYAPEKVIQIAIVVAIIGFIVTYLALFQLEKGIELIASPKVISNPLTFTQSFHEMWSDLDIRQFTIFIFISMLAFSSQDLIMEPFAGLVFDYTVGQTTSLSGLQHSGVLSGMLLVAFCGSSRLRKYFGSLKSWIIYGCLASALAMMGLAIGALVGKPWPLDMNVFLLGLANGTFSIAAIGSMMRLAVADGLGKEGVRIGLWGGAQAIAFGLGGLLGASVSDLARLFMSETANAYTLVFTLESLLFLYSAKLAASIRR
jgi:BCD family chlorophyll transporter-like MFS transporter